jgi:hypothetical protein
MPLLSRFEPRQRARLAGLIRSRAWREIIADEQYLARARTDVRIPPGSPSQSDCTARYLKERNGPSAQRLVDGGGDDQAKLVAALGDWRGALRDDPRFPFHFLGLVLTLDCSFNPRCLYCNQTKLETRMTPADWKRVIAEASSPTPPYVYLTGGEPLLLGEQVWGDDGLIAYAVSRGCAVNINTNAALITPRVAMRLVSVGLARLHISVDSADRATQAALFRRVPRVNDVWRGINNMLIARELLGVHHPQIHINCVMTRYNLFQFPALLRRILETGPAPAGDDVTSDPAFRDFGFHLIPVGGPDNAPIRPSAAEWRMFYTETWSEADEVWQVHQARLRLPAEKRSILADHVPYANPYLRVQHGLTLDEYCERAAQGIYWQGALKDRCYVAPGQAFVLPDGSQHWCGAHAIRRPASIGSVLGSTLRANIRAAADYTARLPIDACAFCAGATCAMNQSIDRNLSEHAAGMLAAAREARSPEGDERRLLRPG